MQTLIEGISKHVSQRETEDLLWFYGRKLMSAQMCANLTIYLRYKSLPGLKGLCDVLETSPKPRHFQLTVRPSMSRKNQLMTIAHEMVHVKQFAKKELDPIVHGNAVKWKGKLYDDSWQRYWSQPWEIEAYGREQGLYMMYCDHLHSQQSAMYPTYLGPDFLKKTVDIDLDLL